MTASPEEALTEILYKTYFEPIKNIMIIDDDYITLREGQKFSVGKNNENCETVTISKEDIDGDSLQENSDSTVEEITISKEDNEKIDSILKSCEDCYIVHIDKRYDTPAPVVKKADFLILDYFLTKTNNESFAINILNEFIQKDSYSLVAIHSNEIPEIISEKISTSIDYATVSSSGRYIYGDGFSIIILDKKDVQISSIEDIFMKFLMEMTCIPPTPLTMLAQLCISTIHQQSNAMSKIIFSDAVTRSGILYHTLSQTINTEDEQHKQKLRFNGLVERIFEEIGNETCSKLDLSSKMFLNYLEHHIESCDDILCLSKELENVVSGDNIDIMLKLNAHLCSHEHKFDHITTGTILKKCKDYFLCASPSCDCVPGRGKDKSCQKNKLGSANYFFYCKLTKVQDCHKKIPFNNPNFKTKSPLSLAEQGKHIFINIHGKVEVFEVINAGNQPKPYIFYAENGGYIDTGRKTITLKRTNYATSTGTLELISQEMTVVGQLRQQYASNLLQRFGMHNSRIGVDFRRLTQ